MQIIRRSSLEEKVLCLIKKRPGHRCPLAWIIVVSVAWEGLALADSDYLYSELVYKLNESGIATNRRCAVNEQRTCACQVHIAPPLAPCCQTYKSTPIYLSFNQAIVFVSAARYN